MLMDQRDKAKRYLREIFDVDCQTMILGDIDVEGCH